MSRFTRSQCTQVVVFCLYWFVAFPFIWFVLQPEFFTGHVLYAVLFALLLFGIYYLIYRIIKCCCTSASAKTPARIENGSRTRNPNPNRNSNQNGGVGGNRNENAFANGNGVYAPTTIAANNVQDRRIEFPDAVLYENTPSRQRVKLGTDADDDEEPFIPEEENKNVRFITSCSLYYDGQGHFHDYK